MKFRLLGNQESLLDDTGHLSPSSLERDGYSVTSGPVNGVLDWPTYDLLRLAHYAYVRAEANSSGYELQASDRAEVRSLFSLAARIRKEVCGARGHRTDEAKFRSALGMSVRCPCQCHTKAEKEGK